MSPRPVPHPAPSRIRTARLGLAALLVLLASAGCGGGVGDDLPCFLCPPPPPGNTIARVHVVGTYEASQFEYDDEDLLPAGAEVTLTLAADGSTSGRLFVPGGAEEGEDLEADLLGTWTYDGYERGVRLVHDADTFLRDVLLQAAWKDDVQGGKILLRGVMEGEGSPRLEVVLRQQ